jgi:hypothetical protein
MAVRTEPVEVQYLEVPIIKKCRVGMAHHAGLDILRWWAMPTLQKLPMNYRSRMLRRKRFFICFRISLRLRAFASNNNFKFPMPVSGAR